jgi:hypothetical protein
VLLGNDVEREEIRGAITADVRENLNAAIAGVRTELRSIRDAGDSEHESFAIEIGGFVALTGGGWPPDQRQEFISQAVHDLEEYPALLVVPAVIAARKRVWDPKRFVSWIVEAVEPAVAKLAVERDALLKLSELAGA